MKKYYHLLIIVFSLFAGSLFAQAPANDLCAGAISLPVTNGSCSSTNYTNVGATNAGNPPQPACWAPASMSHTVWFSFVATSTSVEVSTNFGYALLNTQIAAYSGTCAALTQIACNEDINTSGGLLHTSMQLHGLTVGNTYFLLVDGNGAATGEFGVCVQEILPIGPPSPIQDCQTGQFLCNKNSITISNGTGGPGVVQEMPTCFGSPGERASWWYTFTIGTAGTLCFNISPTSVVDYDFAVFNTTAGCPGTQVACNWSPATGGTPGAGTTGLGCTGTQCETCLNVTVGQTFSILVDRFTASSASGFTLNFGGTALFAAPTPSFSNTTVCAGNATQFTNTTSGSNTYSWNFGDGGTSTLEDPTHTYATAGTYTVSLLVTTNPGGCQNLITQTVTVAAPPTANAGTDVTICAGACVNLAGTSNATGTVGPTSFTNGTDAAIPDNNAAGTTSTIAVTGIAPTTIAATSIASVCVDITHTFDGDLDIFLRCPDGTQIDLSSDNGGGGNNYTSTCFVPTGAAITGGTAPFTGSFTPEQAFTALNGCTANGNWQLFVRDDAGGDVGTLTGWTITFNNNLPPVSWAPTVNMTNSTTLTPNVCPTLTTTYTLTATNPGGCINTDQVTVTVANPPVSSFTAPAAQCLTGNSFSFSPTSTTVTAGVTTYVWNFGDATPATAATTSTAAQTHSYAAAGTYTVSLTTATGSCTNTFTATITVNPMPAVPTLTSVNPTCGLNNGSITVTAPTGGGFTYSINNFGTSQAGTAFTALAPGTYTVSVRNGTICTSTQTVTLTNLPGPTSVNLTAVDANCGLANGSVSIGTVVGGTSGYTYSYNVAAGPFVALTPTVVVNAQAAGTYTVYIRDANNCATNSTISIANLGGLGGPNASSTNATCGSTNGTVTLAPPTTGTGPFTYSFNGGAFAATTNFTNLAAATYTYVVHDGVGCPLNGSIAVNNTAGPTAVALTQVPANCGASNGVINVGVVTGGAGSNQYSINGGGTYQASTSFTSLAAGTYTVTVQDLNNCTTTNTIVVTNSGAPTVNLTAQTNVSCNGGNNGSATFTGAGGGGTYTYTLNTGASNITGVFTNLPLGIYTVTLSDQFACTATQTVSITEPTVLSGNIITQANPLCNGGATGSLTVGGLNGTPAYQFSLNGAGFVGSGVYNGLTAGAYTVTVRDANGCTFPVPVTLTEPTALAVVMSSTNANCTAANGTATGTASGGTSGYTYVWAPSGGTNPTTTGVIGGFYTVTVTDANGCTATGNTLINVTTGGTATISNVTDVSCNGGSDGSITVSMSATAATSYTYAWTPSGGAAAVASGLTAGTYSVTVTDNFGCVANSQAVVAEPLVLTLGFTSTNVSCNGGSDGTINATVNGGTTAYSYVWSPSVGSTPTVSSLPINTYSLTVTDAHGCIVTGTRAITEPTLLTITPVVTNSNCNQSDGAISVTGAGGAGTYTFALNAGAFVNPGNFPGLAANTYTITIKDNNNCTQAYPVTVTDLAGPVANISASANVNCNGVCDGSATVNVVGGVGPYTFAWQNGSVTTTATNLCAGIYTVTATDQNGCVASTGVTITQPTPLVANASGVDPKCNGGSDGTGTAGALGGTPGAGYQFSWTTIPAQNTANATGLTAGPYNVIVTDANGCTSTASITLNNPAALTASITTVDLNCFNQCIGTAAANIGNATLPIQYTWSDGQTTQMATGLCAGPYTVNIIDANNCVATSSATITEPTQLVATIPTTVNETCFNTNDGSAQGNATGGTPGYTYSWSNGFGLANNINLDAGSYTLTVTDNKGCTATANTTVIAPSAISLAVTKTDVLCNYINIIDNTGTAQAIYSGGTAPYTFLWTSATNAFAGDNVQTLPADTYEVLITDANGCQDSINFTVNEPPVFGADTVTTTAHCFQNDGSANASVYGGTAPYIISWDAGTASTPLYSNIPGGFHDLLITDINGCQINMLVGVINIDGPTVSITGSTNLTCFQSNDGTATASITAGTGPYTISWLPVANNGNLNATGFPAGNVGITVTDAAGCPNTAAIVLTEPQELSVVNSSLTDVSCRGGNDGEAVFITSGGTTPYTITFDSSPAQAGATSPSTNSFSNLSLGAASSVTYMALVVDNNGCRDSVNVTITQPQVLIASLTKTDITCFGLNDGQISATVAGGTPGYSYEWQLNTVTQPQHITPDVNSLLPGAYVLIVTDDNGCTDNVSIVIDEPNPILLDSTVSTASCGSPNGSANVLVVGGTPGYTYQWNNAPVNSTLSSASNLSGNLYHCDVTDANGCAMGIDVVVPNAAGPTGVTSTYSALCFGQANGAADVDATGGTAPLVYTWTGSGGTQIVSGPAPNDSISGIMAGTYAVTIQDANGCFFNAVAVVVQPSPVILVASLDQTMCYGASTQISATVGGGTSPYSWTWTHNGVGVPSLSFPTVPASGSLSNGPHTVNPSYTTPLHTYSVTVRDANGCTPIQGQTIDVTALPPIMMTAQSYTVCNNDLVPLSANATGGNTSAGGTITYLWSPGGMTVSSPTVTAQDDPDHQQIFIVTASDGCSSDTSVNHTIFINPTPSASLIGSNLDGCADLDVSFSGSGGTGFPNCVYEWNFGDNTSGFGALINHTYTTNGLQNTSYDVELTVTTPLGCIDAVTMPAYVTVYPNPIAAFTYNPLNTTEFDPLINFYDQSSLASTYQWTFGELTSFDNVSVLQNPIHNYAGPGLYDVNLLVTSINGCVDDVTHPIYIEPEFAIYVPNAFSPNEDGKNELFFPQGIGIDAERFQMLIFDRWGEVIFQTNSLTKGWDGKVDGKAVPVQEDVYIWKIMAYDIKNNKHNLTGHVTVVR